MTVYDLEAIENYNGLKVTDYWRLEGTSFADACLTAQINELDLAHENNREPTIYDEFRQVKKND